MRADRLISMLMLLQTNGRMTAQELSKRLEVSPRTIYRDLDALSAAGVPVYAERGPNGGCMLMESYRTNLTGLKESEVRALFMFSVPGLLADLGVDKVSEAAMLKLTASLPAPFQKDASMVQNRFHLDPTPWFHPDEPTPHLQLLLDAIWQLSRLRMTYTTANGKWVTRLIEPYGLVAKASIWYLIASSGGRPPLMYRVSRMQELRVTNGRFQRPDSFDLADYWQTWCARFEKEQEKYDVTLELLPTAVPAVRQQFGEGVVRLVMAADKMTTVGAVTIQLAFSSAEEACRKLIGMGTAVTILSPLELPQKMCELARQILLAYPGSTEKRSFDIKNPISLAE